MRQIERETIQTVVAMLRGRPRDTWKKTNMMVQASDIIRGREVNVFLHGNHIISVRLWDNGDLFIELSDAGWQTPTTKSRLNAFARAFAVQGVYQRNWEWFFDDGNEFINWIPQRVATPLEHVA